MFRLVGRCFGMPRRAAPRRRRGPVRDLDELLDSIEVVPDAEALARSLPLVPIAPADRPRIDRLLALRASLLAARTLGDPGLRPQLEELYGLDPTDTSVRRHLGALRRDEQTALALETRRRRRARADHCARVVLFAALAWASCVLARGLGDRFVPTLWTASEVAYVLGVIGPDELAREKQAFEASTPVAEARRRKREAQRAHDADLIAVQPRRVRVRGILWHMVPMMARDVEVKVRAGGATYEDAAKEVFSSWRRVTPSPLLVELGSRRGDDIVNLSCEVKRAGVLWGIHIEGKATWAGPLADLAGVSVLVGQVCTITFDVEPLAHKPSPSDVPAWQPRHRPGSTTWAASALLPSAFVLAFAMACALGGPGRPACAMDRWLHPLWPRAVLGGAACGLLSGVALGAISGWWLAWLDAALLLGTVGWPVLWIVCSTGAKEPLDEAASAGAISGGLAGLSLGALACWQGGLDLCWGGFLTVVLGVGMALVVGLAGRLTLWTLGPAPTPVARPGSPASARPA